MAKTKIPFATDRISVIGPWPVTDAGLDQAQPQKVRKFSVCGRISVRGSLNVTTVVTVFAAGSNPAHIGCWRR